MGLKKRLFSFALMATITLGCYSESTLAATAVLDNDALSGAPGYNKVRGIWSYKKGTGYNGDLRAVSSSRIANASYLYSFNASNKNVSYYAYINSKSATNPKAAYQLGEGTNNYKYVNQNTAPGGWYFLGRKSNRHIFVSVNGAISSRQGILAADAMKIKY